MPDPRPCCILGVCCDPGGRQQRDELIAWLAEKLAAHNGGEPKDVEGVVTGWVDELFEKSEEVSETS